MPRSTKDPKLATLGFRVNEADRRKLMAHLAATRTSITEFFRDVIRSLPDHTQPLNSADNGVAAASNDYPS